MNVSQNSTSEFPKSNKFVKRHGLILFFILSYSLITFAVIMRTFLGGAFPEILFWFISYWSPTISAIIISGLSGGWTKIKSLLKGLLKWRVEVKWYLVAFLIMLAPLLFALIYILIGGESPGIDPSLTLPLLVFNLFYTLFSGPLSEELGWRGFALPRLQSRFSALLSSIILGFVWVFWHLPLYFIPPQRIAIYIFIPLVLVISILMTWVYNNTSGSVLLTIMMHFSFNFDMAFIVGYLGLMPSMVFYISASIAIGIYLIAVIVYAGPKKLSKKPISEIPRIT